MQSEQQTSADPALPGVDRVNAPLMARLRSALAAKGSAYQPRTHHLEPDASPKYVNRLIFETSPYLLQHAHNPVNWFPWSEEAFERARREGKPVLVSVGYSTCHWCHVMERESFEDEEIARYINQNYIAIKVDREERPDVDDLYMKAVQTLTGRGGWPMTVVLTPGKEPFFGGTYFPARDGDRGGSKGFLTLLRELKTEYTANRDKVLARARQLSRHIQAASTPGPSGSVPGADAIIQVVDNAKASFDSSFGGFGRAPKFPRPVLLELLLRYQRRTRDTEALEMVTVTLERMAAGGIYDQVGGGFHRYSTDARWLVPHFEKMLYDNAELVPLYLDAHQITGQERYAEVARDVLHYIAREMTAPEGAFYSATDADSPTPSGHHEEGYFFTWTPSEIEAVLDEELAHTAALFFGVTPRGNFEGRNILHVPRSESTVALELGIAVVELRRRLTEIRQQLYAARSQRKAPERDHKLLTSWNGLMISAFARAALVLGDHDYASRAQRAADFVLRNLQKADGRLLRSFNEGHARYEGYLDDYAFLIQALLDLYEATPSPQHIEQATSLQKILDRHFWDQSSGGYFMTSEAHEPLLARDKPTYDGAEPSGNSVAVMNLLRLAEITGQQPYRQRAEQSLSAFAHALAQSPGAYPKLLSALEYYLDRPLEVFLILPPDNTDPEPLLAAFRRAYLPNRVFTMTREGPELDRLTKLVPALQDKRALGGRPTAFVCERGRCELPTSDSQVFRQQLAKVQKLVPSD